MIIYLAVSGSFETTLKEGVASQWQAAYDTAKAAGWEVAPSSCASTPGTKDCGGSDTDYAMSAEGGKNL